MFKAWSNFWANRARKRREEKLRHSQHIEDTFSERLSSRSVAGKSSSKIDVGFTSQQTLNQDPEDGERRPTFSRFLKLWKGLRNSKRKPTNGNDNDEPRRSVVFTIPTEDVFPKTHTRQQTHRQDAVTQTDGFQTHMCEVHRVTHDIIEDYSNHDLHQLDDELDTICENETCRVEVTTEISNHESGSTETGAMLVGGEANTRDRKSSEEKYLQGKEEGKSFSKESDVDSGCGSSCHEMYATEPQITHAQLNVSSLVYCHAQKTGIGEPIEKGRFLEDKGVETKIEFELCSSLDSVSNEQYSQELQKSEVEADSFEELIKLAKDGMSTLARKRVDNGGKKNTISDCFQATTQVDTLADAQDISTNTNEELQSKDGSLDSRIESRLYLNARQVDSEVKCASSISSCLEDNADTGKTLHSITTGTQSDTSLPMPMGKTLHYTTTGNNSDASIGKTLHCSTKESHSGTSMDKKLYSTTTDNQPNKSTNSATCVVEISTITLESKLETVNNSLETTAENLEVPCLPNQDSLCQDSQVNNNKCTEDDSKDKTNDGSTIQTTQKAVTFDKRNDLPLRIQESLLNNANVITEKVDRPKSLVLPSTNDSTVKSMYSLKVPSLETLNLPSHGQTTEHTGRIRSFSASIRRKLSFRERVSSDDLDIEKHAPVDSNNKKLKGFRSFRINRKKKTKALKNDEISHSTGCLSDSKKYWSTIDKIFHESTGSAIFSDVPFTIPEISE